MKHVRTLAMLASFAAAHLILAQEATSGVDLRGTLTAQAIGSNELTEKPRSGSAMILGARAIAYPTIKFDENWFLTGALQLVTRPYFYSDLETTGYGAKGSVLQATANYSRVSSRGSLLVRAGVMSSAFGSFLLRYDDADNALVDFPAGYGYYYAPISFRGVAGAQVDVSRGKFDGRLQFANSSPANPRSIFARDQYGNWAGGGGYTIRQGLRVGVSGYRGPYLDRKYAFFFPGEAKPSSLPAHAVGVDANWAQGHTSSYMELQRFTMPYKLLPNFHVSVAYGEVKQVLNPRWSLAFRYSYSCDSAEGASNTYEGAVGFRADRWQLLKAGYEEKHYRSATDPSDHVVGIQFITTFHRSLASK